MSITSKTQLKKPLSNTQYANLFAQMSRLERSGLPPSTAFSLVMEGNPKMALPLKAIQQAVSKGDSISKTGIKYGILTESQAAIIAAAEASGQLMETYERLADLYENKVRRIKKIKSKLVMPIMILLSSALLGFLPDLATGKISGLAYLWHVLKMLAPFFLASFFVLKLSSIMAALGLGKTWEGLQLKLPMIGDWVVNRQVNEFFNVLGLMLHAGIDFHVALPKAVKAIPNGVLRDQFIPVVKPQYLQQGHSVYDTLSQVPAIAGAIVQMINSGEQSGSLSQSILHRVKIQNEDIALQDEMLASFIPKVIYTLIAVQAAWSVIESYRGMFAPIDIQ